MFAGQQIPKSPFEVNVDKALGDASKVTVKGPGIEPVGNVANKPTYFDIFTAGQRHKHTHRYVYNSVSLQFHQAARRRTRTGVL